MKKHRIPIVSALAVVVIVAIWYAALWMPEGSRLKAAKLAEQQAQQQVATNQAQLTALRGQEPKVPGEEKVLRSLVTAVPDGPSLDQLVETINDAARKSGVSIATLGTPQPSGWAGAPGSGVPATQTGPESITLSVNIVGLTGNILRFVKAVDAEPRLYVVDTLDLQPTSAAPYTASLSIETFFESSAANDPTFPG